MSRPHRPSTSRPPRLPGRRPVRLSRRLLLEAGLAAFAVTTLASACSGPGNAWKPPVEFDTPLPIPPLADSRLEDGTRVFALTIQQGTHEFRPGVRTPTWGFDGSYLGPTLRAAVGEDVRVDVVNDLDVETTVHWHGMHLPAEMDGGPHQPIAAGGGTWSPSWQVRQAPATLWYHPHPHGETEEHVYRGLAGLFLLDDAADAEGPALPSTYGVDDVPIIVQDKLIDVDGRLVFDDGGNEIGLLGNLVLTNGVAGATFAVSAARTRLRLLNGSTARTYDIGMSDRRTVQLVASDGGLLEAPVAVETVRLSPGERAELVVTFEPGETVHLHTFGADLGDVAAPQAFGAEDEADLLEFRVGARPRAGVSVPATLATIERLEESSAEVRRTFELEGRDINGQQMEMDRVDAIAHLGAVEVWSVHNRNLFPHNFHVHDVQLQVLAIDGSPPPPELAGLKDTVYLEPRRTYDLIMRFDDYADPTHPYMFHCHLLLHEDDGMMGQFVVVEPGDDDLVEIEGADHDH